MDASNTNSIVARICRMARAVLRDPPHIGVLSTGERCAVALVLNRLDLLPAHYSVPLEAADRLGVVWLTAAVLARRELGEAGVLPDDVKDSNARALEALAAFQSSVKKMFPRD
jgi:hypothetical protein